MLRIVVTHYWRDGEMLRLQDLSRDELPWTGVAGGVQPKLPPRRARLCLLDVGVAYRKSDAFHKKRKSKSDSVVVPRPLPSRGVVVG